MVRSAESRDEGSTENGSAGDGGRLRRSGRPRDDTLDEAIILATRDRLVRDGYSNMTIGDIAADAKITRPTLYRRWQNKFDLVVDALDYGFRKQAGMYTVDLSQLAPRDALVEAVGRLDPAYYNPDAMVLMGNFAGESLRTPELLEILRKHGVDPRVALLKSVLGQLQKRRSVRPDIDVDTIADMCFGSYFSAFYRGEQSAQIPERVVAVLWPCIAAKAATQPRGARGGSGRATKRRVDG
jgi:AcrR family transcriptional regulator